MFREFSFFAPKVNCKADQINGLGLEVLRIVRRNLGIKMNVIGKIEGGFCKPFHIPNDSMTLLVFIEVARTHSLTPHVFMDERNIITLWFRTLRDEEGQTFSS